MSPKYARQLLMLAAVRFSVCEGGSAWSSSGHANHNPVGDQNRRSPLMWSVLQPDLAAAGAPSTVAAETDGAIAEAVDHLGDWYYDSREEAEDEHIRSSLTYYHPVPISQRFYIHVVITPLQLMAVGDVYYECREMLDLMYEQYPNGIFPRGNVRVQLNKVRIFYTIRKFLSEIHTSLATILRWRIFPSDPLYSHAPSIVTANIDAAISLSVVKLGVWYRALTKRGGMLGAADIRSSQSYFMHFPSQGFFIHVILSPLLFPMPPKNFYLGCNAILFLMYKDFPSAQFPIGKVKVELNKVQISYAVKRGENLENSHNLKEKKD